MPTIAELSKPVAALPLILCGPILRRVEADSVSVWVALKEKRKLRFKIWTGLRKATESLGEPFLATKNAVDTVQIGANLHIAVVTINKDTAGTQVNLAPDTVFSYNLFFNDAGDEDLAKLKQLEGSAPLGFVKDQLPSFLSAPLSLENLRIAHGSCRKAYGQGDDGLAILARLLKDPASLRDHRPHCFVHTGDQIYADDVAYPLLPFVTQTGNALLGKTERFPFPADEKNAPTPDIKTENYRWFKVTETSVPVARRRTNRYTAFTGGSSMHLTSFAEFCAMYLYAWSDVVWPEKLLTFSEIKQIHEDNNPKQPPAALSTDVLPIEYLGDTFKQREEKDEHPEEGYNGEKARTEKFRSTLPLVRQVLANMPNLMIFDDHDVTDDWYLNGDWTAQALATLPARLIVRNGLMAFALFQAWGNMPAAFAKADDPRKKLLDNIPKLVEKFDLALNAQLQLSGGFNDAYFKLSDTICKSLGADAFAKQPSPEVKWHYSVKVGPAKILVLDTRTRRDFSGKMYQPAGLLHEAALQDQIPDTAALPDTELLFVVSAAPVLGLGSIESLGQVVTASILQAIRSGKDDPDGKTGQESLDAEAWSLNRVALERLLKRLAPLKKVVFLSGDVHYGIASFMDYWRRDGAAAQSSRFVQFVSSSLNNQKPTGALTGLLSSSLAQLTLAGGFNREFSRQELLGWDKKDGIQFKLRDEEGKFADARSQDVPMRFNYAMLEKPVLFSLRNWPLMPEVPFDNTNDKFVPEVAFSKTTPDPNWRWRLQLVHDKRPDGKRAASLAITDLTEDVPEEITGTQKQNYRDRVKALLTRSAKVTRNHLTRRVSWFTNVGLVRFGKDADNKLEAVHDLFFYPEELSPKVGTEPKATDAGTFALPFMQHKVSLSPQPAADQPAVPRES